MNYLLLVAAALAGGYSAFLLPGLVGMRYRLALVFSGAYLFAITITHLLPELFHQDGLSGTITGVLILAGFFFQQLLEYLSQGVEHGHIHIHKEGHAHLPSSAVWVLLALSLHALMEGAMLTEGHTDNSTSGPLLGGILMHKIPEAFALVSVLSCELRRREAILMLLLFSLASPVGLWVSTSLSTEGMVNGTTLQGLFAFVCGSFLHISTTIVFESSADHHFNARKLAIAILGSACALAAGLLF
ncbi:MAG: ZIP family metal transporter [Bacteroidota bacterium]